MSGVQTAAKRVPLGTVLAACVALAALTLLLPSIPTYDPWAWLTWGRELTGLDLDTREGPAFKPLPVAVGALLAPAGGAAPWLWLAFARAAALLAVVMAWRLGRRLAGGSPLAGTVAAAGVVLADGWLWNGAVGNTEGLLLALALVGAERALDGHHRQALVLALAAALVRTEAVPFLLAYTAWLWPRDPRARPLAIAGLAALPVLWLGPDLLGSGDALRSSERARIPNPGAPALSGRPALESLGRAVALAPTVVWAGVALAPAAVARRELPRLTLLPALAGAAWVLMVALMSEAGYSGEERYAMPGVALMAVTAGAGVAWAAGAVRPLRRRPAVVAALLAVVALGQSAPGLADDARSLRYEARLYGALDAAVASAGGRDAVLRCRPLHTAPYSRPALAWRLGVPIHAISTEPASAGTAFTARPFRGAPRGPALGTGFRETGRAGSWRVLATCR